MNPNRFTFKRLGHCILLQGISKQEALKRGSTLLKQHAWAKSVYYLSEIKGIERKPKVEWLLGEQQPLVTHKELNTYFIFDLRKVMFSPGNHAERQRLIMEVPSNSTVVDMFCAIGNLSLPLAVNRKDVHVIGIEISPETFHYLLVSIQKNKLQDRFKAIKGDNRLLTPKNVADVVLMGFFNWDERQLEVAINALKDQNGIIYLHHTIKGNTPPKVIPEIVQRIASRKNAKITLLKAYKVKKIGPYKLHFVNKLKVSSK